MKKCFRLAAWLFLCVPLLTSGAAPANDDVSPKAAVSPGKSTPGVEAAQALSTITGVAISPLLGVSGVGVWKYFKTPPAKRAQLPWFAQPYFWVPGLLLVTAVFVKDALGTALPVALKKPFDVLEVFENKMSALIAAGAFVPLVAAVFGAAGAANDSTSVFNGMGLAMIDPSPLLNALTIPFAMAIFLIVWLVAHMVNVLILLSPFGIVDAALKSARLLVLSALTFASISAPYLGAALSVVIIVVCYFLSGWAFRMSVFGTVFAWDLLTMRQNRFKPNPAANWMFTARKIQTTPVRSYGKLSRDDKGQLVFKYRPWLIRAARVLVLPAGKYAVGRGLLYPELLQMDGDYATTVINLPPRYRTHEHELAGVYNLAEVQDVGALKGVKAVWRWLKELLGFKVQRLEQPAPP